jgi:hypothetical protein
VERPTTAEEIAALLAEGRRARPVGGGTKRDWGALGPAPEVEISTLGLDALVERPVPPRESTPWSPELEKDYDPFRWLTGRISSSPIR